MCCHSIIDSYTGTWRTTASRTLRAVHPPKSGITVAGQHIKCPFNPTKTSSSVVSQHQQIMVIAHLSDVSNRVHFDHLVHRPEVDHTADINSYYVQMFQMPAISGCLLQWISPRFARKCRVCELCT